MSSCPHISQFKSKLGPNWFRVLAHCLRVKPLGRASIIHDPGELPCCLPCGSHPSPSPSGLYACLSCASVFCCPHAGSDPNPCHVIGVDVDRAELFCFICLDQIYDRDFDTTVILVQKAVASSSLLQHPSLPQTDNSHFHKRRRIDYVPWSADPLEKSLTQNNSTPLNYDVGNNTLNGNVAGNNDDNGNVVEPSLPLGLRGLNNLGNTCFMNSVLQVLLHTPPLRNYFLSDRHNRYSCKQKRKSNCTLGNGGGRNLSSDRGGRGGGCESNSKVNHLCLACDLDEIFSAVFKGDRTPFSPSSFLYSWWQHAANLASYEQQDAHEFFISMLAGIHEKVERDLRKPQSQGNGDCCIAHRVFSGILRSDVMCMACGFTSTTYDPCVDISLDLEPNKGNSSRTASAGTKSYGGLANGTNPSQNRGISTLLGCLDRFTRPERLGSDQKFFCQQCQVKQESLKQMSIRKLPLVSCFHIKRFEHSAIRKMSKKVDHYLQFPFSLNMAPYLSSSILRSRYGNRMFTFDEDDPETPTEPSSEFELFAVVTHSGRLDAGHYITYLRLSNHWYKCDDAWITEVSETIVRAAQGYMMFYVQKMFYYKASESKAPCDRPFLKRMIRA